MTGPRTSGVGRRFELVLIRLRPPFPGTAGLIAKHAGRRTYHWVLLIGSRHARPGPLSRLLAVAYLDEASGVLGRGDPRWSVPRAYLRTDGCLDTEERPRWDSPGLPPFVREELDRISHWLRDRQGAYLDELIGALRPGAVPQGFERLGPEDTERRGFTDPTGRALLAPPPPPVVTRTRPRPEDPRQEHTLPHDPADRLPWRRLHIGRS